MPVRGSMRLPSDDVLHPQGYIAEIARYNDAVQADLVTAERNYFHDVALNLCELLDSQGYKAWYRHQGCW
jgi:hypothetical protein